MNGKNVNLDAEPRKYGQSFPRFFIITHRGGLETDILDSQNFNKNEDVIMYSNNQLTFFTKDFYDHRHYIIVIMTCFKRLLLRCTMLKK